MLVGGFITYHQVQGKLVDLERKISAVTDDLDKAKEKYITVRVCEQARVSCIGRMDRADERQDRLEEKLETGFNRLYEKLYFIKDALNHKADRRD
jgi:hypothetical protein